MLKVWRPRRGILPATCPRRGTGCWEYGYLPQLVLDGGQVAGSGVGPDGGTSSNLSSTGDRLLGVWVAPTGVLPATCPRRGIGCWEYLYFQQPVLDGGQVAGSVCSRECPDEGTSSNLSSTGDRLLGVLVAPTGVLPVTCPRRGTGCWEYGYFQQLVLDGGQVAGSVLAGVPRRGYFQQLVLDGGQVAGSV